MKGSITKKLVMTYTAVLGVFLVITVLLLNITARSSLESNILKNLHTESAVIEELYRERVAASVNDTQGEGIKEMRNLIKSWFSDIKKLSEIGFSSDIALVVRTTGDKFGIFTPGETSNEVNFRSIKPRDLEANLQDKPHFFKIIGGETSYYSVSRPLSENKLQKSGMKAWIISYTPVQELYRLVSGMNLKGAYALGIALLISAFLSYYLSINISKPIKALKNHAEKIAFRDFKARVNISTGDEIESLGNAMNKIAGDLSDYDQSQRRFLQNVSHELKTPVMSIMGYVEGLRDGVISNKDKAHDIIISECSRLQRLINEVMYLSKLETVEEFYTFKCGSLNDVLKEAVDKVKSLAEPKGINIELKLEDVCQIEIDNDKLLQAFLNLLSNAIRYARDLIVIETKLTDQTVEIRFFDDGEGINEKELSQVFERFYKGKKGSSGLGLTITKAIVEKHKGIITAANNSHGGAVFTLIFPLAGYDALPNYGNVLQ